MPDGVFVMSHLPFAATAPMIRLKGNTYEEDCPRGDRCRYVCHCQQPGIGRRILGRPVEMPGLQVQRR
jgi:hypothetical protein